MIGKINRFVALTLLLTVGGGVSADTVLTNITGYTPTASGIRAFSTIVVSDDGKVLAIGDDSLSLEFAEGDLIDGDGRFVLPGLVDAHGHVQGLGQLASSLNLFGVASLQDAVSAIADFAQTRTSDGWILGRGWNQVLWAVQEFPTARDIDAVVSDRPVWLRRVDGHAGWANTAALQAAGIDTDTVDPQGGKILRDGNGNATGVLIDTAMALVTRVIPPASKAELRDNFLAAFDELAALGVTGVHDAGISRAQAEVYLSLADDGLLPIRVYAMVRNSGSDLDTLDEPVIAYGNDRLDIRTVKLVADGALGSRGAAMIEPYSDDPENTGLRFWSKQQLADLVDLSHSRGFQVAIHAIGDSGNQISLDVLAALQARSDKPLRNRIEHAQVVSQDDIGRFAEHGIIASIQPTHATSDMNMAEDRVGPDRIRGAYAWRALLDSGAAVAAGSDFPVELPNPFHGLYAAVTRQDRNGMPANGWYADQAMTRAEALHAFTLGAAFAAFHENTSGSLEAGKWADFIIVDRDYFAVAASDIDDIVVLETWVGGERVYKAER